MSRALLDCLPVGFNWYYASCFESITREWCSTDVIRESVSILFFSCHLIASQFGWIGDSTGVSVVAWWPRVREFYPNTYCNELFALGRARPTLFFYQLLNKIIQFLSGQMTFTKMSMEEKILQVICNIFNFKPSSTFFVDFCNWKSYFLFLSIADFF